MLDGGITLDGARSVNGDRGGAGGCCVGLSLRADESGVERRGTGWVGGSPNGTGKAARAGEIGTIRPALEGILMRCKAGGMGSRSGVETRSGGGGAAGNW